MGFMQRDSTRALRIKLDLPDGRGCTAVPALGENAFDGLAACRTDPIRAEWSGCFLSPIVPDEGTGAAFVSVIENPQFGVDLSVGNFASETGGTGVSQFGDDALGLEDRLHVADDGEVDVLEDEAHLG